MALERIINLPADSTPSANDVVPIDNITTRKSTLEQIADAGAPIASQSEAEAGTNPKKRMTPLTTKQAIVFQGGTLFATAAQGAKADSAVQPGALGTMAPQNANSVAITGGTITGITDLAVADGGTGASTTSGARNNLGLGTISTQDASAVTITGGSVTGITDLAIADGGTGASTATNARTNLGLGTIATQAASNVSITGGAITGITPIAIAEGGTGASSAPAARTNLGLGGLATKSTIAVPADITASGTASSTTFLRGDGSWNAVPAASAAQTRAQTSSTVFLTPSNLNDRASFYANKNNVDQTGITSAITKVTFGTAYWDTGSFYSTANSRWTPPAGKVRIGAGIRVGSGLVNQTTLLLAIYKNGAQLLYSGQVTTPSIQSFSAISTIDIASGTDYYEIWVLGTPSASTFSVDGSVAVTNFFGEQI